MTTVKREPVMVAGKDRTADERRRISDQETGRSLIFLVGVLAGIGAIIVVLTAPAQVLTGESAHAVTSALHATVAGLLMVATAIGVYQGYRLFEGRATSVSEIQIATAVTAALSALTILFGNWIYAVYRPPAGSRDSFLSSSPALHQIFFEFKEFTALFTLPLAVVAAFLAYYYGKELLTNERLRVLVAVVLVLVFSYFLVAFGLGSAIPKLKAE